MMMRGINSFLFAVLLLCCVNIMTKAQIALPNVKQVLNCTEVNKKTCMNDCMDVYKDPRRFLCPCYSRMGYCLVQFGCTLKEKVDVYKFCTRKGYCKDGYCKYRAGDHTPKIDVRPEVFDVTSVKPPHELESFCVDGCCPNVDFPNEFDEHCTIEQKSWIQQIQKGRHYRQEEVKLPPRQGDPRTGVNQNYDRMPYSISLDKLPEH